MKLLVVAPYFYPKIGGMENYAWNISKGLKEKYGWDIAVITSNHIENKYIEEIISGIKIYRLPMWFKISNTPINPLWVFFIKKIIKKEKPDIINAHSPVPFIADITALASNKIPYILTYHGSTMKKNKFILDLIISFYENKILKRILIKANKIICVSGFIQKNFLKEYKNKTIVVTPGVDMNIFKPAINRSIGQKTILCIGGLKKAENYKRIIDIFYALKMLHDKNVNTYLSIVGEGDNIDYFKSICKKLGISKHVTFKGKLIGLNLVKEYQKADVIVLPSVNDSFGMVLIEAMACKIPVIGASIGGIPEIIQNNIDGLTVPPLNISALAGAILKIITNKKKANQFAKKGYKKIINNYQWEEKIYKTNEIFTKINI